MNFELTEQQKQIQSAARHFVDELLIPLEPELLRNEREGRPGIELRQIRELQQKAKTQGLWGIETPEEYGGANLGTVTSALLKMELGRTCIPFVFGGSGQYSVPLQQQGTTEQVFASRYCGRETVLFCNNGAFGRFRCKSNSDEC